jgi:HK97 family phage major capsid protein
MRRMTVRDLVAPGRTESGSVEYAKQTLRDNQAAPTAEGEEKPESDYTWELKTATVRTIAHWVPVSRQAMDDAPALASLIDTELRYGLRFKEELQLLKGTGIGQNLSGLVTEATAFEEARRAVGDTELDIIKHALSQLEEAEVEPNGVILSVTDWRRMMGIKDEEDRYIGGGPFVMTPRVLWGLPVIPTNAMDEDEFLVGDFQTAAQIFDRMDPEVLISSEDRDNFIKNMLTVRAEERLAFAVKRPDALVHGNLSAPS